MDRETYKRMPLATALRRAAFTQLELAEEIGVTQNWVSRRVRGEVSPTVDDLQRIAKALDCPLSDLLPVEQANQP